MKKGFTLIELLIVISIMAILSGIVFASLGSSRAKARDGKRISDIGQIQLALQLFYEQNRTYPTFLYTNAAFEGIYIPSVPKDPNGNQYPYVTNLGRSPTDYHLGAVLEQVSPSSYNSNVDFNTNTSSKLSGWSGDFYGISTNCTGIAETTVAADRCYDVKG